MDQPRPIPMRTPAWPMAAVLAAAVAIIMQVACALAIAADLPDAAKFAVRVEQGDLGTVGEWLDDGLDPDFHGDRSDTGLMIAAAEGFIPMMALFVRHGADVNRANAFNEQALMHAAWKGHLDAVVWLLEHGAQIKRDGNEWSALHYATFAGHEAIARRLIEKGADINARSTNGSTVLMMAAREGGEKIARMLLDAGADRSARNDSGEGALTWSMRYQHLTIAKMVSEPAEFAQAVAKPQEVWGEPVNPILPPAEVAKIIQEDRAARANGRERTLSADQYRTILDRLSKMKQSPLPGKQPRRMSITVTKGDPRKEKAELLYGK